MSVVVLIVFITTAVVVYCFYKLTKTISYINIMNRIPGPTSVPFFGNIFDFHKPPEIIFKTLEQYGKEYHPIYKLVGCNYVCVFINTPEDIEIILSTTKHLEKSKMYNSFHIWLGSGLLTSSGEKWHERRKILTPTFHFNILQQYTLTFIEKGEKLVNELERLVYKDINIDLILNKYTFSTICETAMGTTFEDSIDKYRKAVMNMGEITIHRVTRPWYYPLLTYMTSLKFYEAVATARFLHSCSRDIIRKRKENFNINDVIMHNSVHKSKNRLAMLDMLFHAKSTGDHIDDEGIREEVDTFIFEGHDTTASCLSFTLMLLACNKDVQDRAAKELHELLPNKEDQVTFEVLNNMKYLERVIKESLRLYPSVPQFGRFVTETVKTHSGFVILPETDVMIRVYDMHRNPEIYSNPKKFDPDRFLPENVKKRHPYAYIPFSAGPRNCIGQKFALLELKTFLSAILRRFEILPVDNPDTITLTVNLVLHTKDGICVKLLARH